MEDRVILATIARGMVLKAKAGRVRCNNALRRAPQFLVRMESRTKRFVMTVRSISTPIRPDIGNQPRFNEKMSMSTSPNQNTGILTPKSDPSILA
jgi:hypothetical protein